jgi:hypothetical protein
MSQGRNKPILIVRRLPDGSLHFVDNQDPRECDIDGRELWITPSGQLYCNEVHAKPNVAQTPFSEDPSNKPHELSNEEWKEIIALPVVKECWGVDDDTTPEQFAEIAYGVRFDFVSGSPGYVGDLYVLCGDALGEPLTLIRRGEGLEAI